MGEERKVFHLHDHDLPPEALDDHCKPPEQPILVRCIHCDEEYDSWQMIWVPFTEEELARNPRCGMKGFWRCPMEGCTGAGFTIDIWPADPDYVDPDTGEKYWQDDPPMIEGHESDCECVECEMLRDEEEAEMEREMRVYEEKVERGEIKPPPTAPPPSSHGFLTEDDIPF